eukprot:jgi/Botrbrau1/19478/Bobra.0338s0095.1
MWAATCDDLLSDASVIQSIKFLVHCALLPNVHVLRRHGCIPQSCLDNCSFLKQSTTGVCEQKGHPGLDANVMLALQLDCAVLLFKIALQQNEVMPTHRSVMIGRHEQGDWNGCKSSTTNNSIVSEVRPPPPRPGGGGGDQHTTKESPGLGKLTRKTK